MIKENKKADFSIYLVKKEVFVSFLLIGILFILFVFRKYNVGTDTQSYVDAFVSGDVKSHDQGFKFLVQFIRIITLNPRIYLMILGTSILWPIFKSSILNSPRPVLSIVLFAFFFYPYSLNILRQFVSISIFYYWGIKYINEKNLLRYLVIIFICSSIHLSSIILVPLYFLANKKYNIYVLLTIWLLSIFLAFFASGEDFFLFFQKTQTFIELFYNLKRNYLAGSQSLVIKSSYIRLITFNLLLLIALLNYKKFSKGDHLIFFNLFFISIVFYNILYQFMVLGRIVFYFEVSLIFLIPIVIVNLKSKTLSRILSFLFVLLAIVFFLKVFYLNGEAGIFNRA